MKDSPCINRVCLTSLILVFNDRFNNYLAVLVILKYNLSYIGQLFRAEFLSSEELLYSKVTIWGKHDSLLYFFLGIYKLALRILFWI